MDCTAFATHVQEVEPGWFRSPTQSAVCYPPGGLAECASVEGDSFWFLHRNDVLLAALRRFPPPGTIVDVGGGNGFQSLAFHQAGHSVVLLEPDPQGVSQARARGVPWIIQATLSDAGIPDGALPSAALLDVLEHLPDDVAALKELHRGLAPGARLYLTVPSLAALWSRFDESAGHFRRYTPLGLRRVVQTAGFEVEWLTGFFTFLTVPIWALRATRERFETPREARCGVGDHRPDATFRALLGVLGAAELAAVRSGWQLPGGASCLAVARKP